MRGKELNRRERKRCAGITPACAGKSRRARSWLGCRRDHPRVCGEKELPRMFSLSTMGSPPRVRGKVNVFFTLVVPGRITPACAGKSWPMNTQTRRQGDHPRVCGEKSPRGHCLCYPIGSPPRVRGKEAARFLDRARRRITPACAGKSIQVSGPLNTPGDHPRVCGEKATGGNQNIESRGSPPRVRGKARFQQKERDWTRITPACAGKSGLSGT